MRGFCKCDLCGVVYHKDDNKEYDGITVWYLDRDGDSICGQEGSVLIDGNGEKVDKIPEKMDICPKCFDRFCNWIKIVREETK